MSDKKSSSDATNGDDTTSHDDVTSTPEGTDPVMTAGAGDTGPAIDLIAVEHDPRPAGMVLGGSAEGTGPDPVAVVHDPRGDGGKAVLSAAATTGAAGQAAPPPVPPEAAPVSEPARTAEKPHVAEKPEARRSGGFFPALLGGLIAAAIGFGAAYMLQQQGNTNTAAQIEELSSRQAQQGEALESLRSTVETGPDLSGVDTQVSDLGARIDELSSRLDVMAGDMDTATGRIDALEKRPITDTVSQEAIAAYEAELERLKQAMADQRTEVEALVEDARQMESDANVTAQATLRRAALTRILSALETGAPYAAALADLQAAGQEVPEPLAANAESGVPSLADLRSGYPDAAREALQVARSSSSDSAGRSIGNFLRDHLGARSLEPRDGTDADAVLSRAEDALRTGRLGDALAELETLPDEARAELADWTREAETRRAAVAAAEDLNAALSQG